MGACFPLSTTPRDPESRRKHALFSISNTVNIDLSIALFYLCFEDKAILYVYPLACVVILNFSVV